MNKSVMNAIEVLSKQYNFPMDEAVSLFTVKNKSKKTKKEGQSLQDMFAELVNDVEQDNREPVIVLEPTVAAAVAVAVAPVVKEKKEKAKKQPLSEEEKKQKAEELLAQKEAAKKQKAEELLAAKEAAKKQKEEDLIAQKKQKAEELLAQKKQKADELLAQKEAAKKQKADELLAQKEAAKKQKEDEKLAAKEAAKAAKAPKEPKAKAVKEPKEKAVKAKAVKADESPDRETPTWVEPPPIKITVTRVKIGDQTYLKSTAGILYNADTKEEVGLHDEETNTIKPLPEDGDEELEEETYEA
jgi:hypothetical protein